MSDKQILLIGASGVFGSRLVEQIIDVKGISLTLAGRGRTALETISKKLGIPTAIKIIDRDMIKSDDLNGFDMVIDAAGPFQKSHTMVIDAAIAAKCHYLDLSDGREFLNNISQFDADARKAGIAVISGASSIPALSHAVIDDITHRWQQIDNLKVGIFPGNRTSRGLSVVEAILTYIGKPVRVFRNGEWQNVYGWSMTHQVKLPKIGKRWASVCDTPEQDLLVERYKPKNSAEFFAGMELTLLHLGLLLLSFPVRWRWISSLRPFAAFLLWLANLMVSFGSDKGGMEVRADGISALSKPISSRWILHAEANKGPYVPTLAALIMVRKFVKDGGFSSGARPCSGILKLSDFNDDFKRLNIVTSNIN